MAGATTADSALLPRLVSQSAQRVASDPRISALLSAWSACMARAGLHFATPEDAARDKRWKPRGRPSKEETATAIADVRCKDEVGYLTTVVSVATEDQRALIEEHAAELGLIARLRAVKADNVARALS